MIPNHSIKIPSGQLTILENLGTLDDRVYDEVEWFKPIIHLFLARLEGFGRIHAISLWTPDKSAYKELPATLKADIIHARLAPYHPTKSRILRINSMLDVYEQMALIAVQHSPMFKLVNGSYFMSVSMPSLGTEIQTLSFRVTLQNRLHIELRGSLQVTRPGTANLKVFARSIDGRFDWFEKTFREFVSADNKLTLYDPTYESSTTTTTIEVPDSWKKTEVEVGIKCPANNPSNVWIGLGRVWSS